MLLLDWGSSYQFRNLPLISCISIGRGVLVEFSLGVRSNNH